MLFGVCLAVFVACYVAALGLELWGLNRHAVGRRPALAAAALVGLAAHSCYLAASAVAAKSLPLSSPSEWLVVAAWVLALAYAAAIFYLPSTATGLVLLPMVLGLLAAAATASREPFAPERSFYAWGMAHGVALLLGVVAVCIGFLAGLMYLLQSYALRHAQAPAGGIRLPSLEWLQRINSRSLAVSTLLVTIGFASGLVLSLLTHQGEAAAALWTDPVVLSSAAMLLWLVAAEVFRLVYPAARQGRKVAYLTLASFVFVVITVLSLTLFDSGHGL